MKSCKTCAHAGESHSEIDGCGVCQEDSWYLLDIIECKLDGMKRRFDYSCDQWEEKE